jgi:glycosyltransferase involved in cell wall biosynthesis
LRQRFEVVWIEPALGWRDHWLRRGGPPRHPTATGVEGLTIYEPGRWLAEVYRPRRLGDALRRTRLRAARRILERKGCERIVLYLWRPEFAWALDATRAHLTCYHIDDEYRFVDAGLPNDAAEAELIRRVDRVIVHSRRLMAKKGGINPNTIQVPNGVDYAAYSSPTVEPADLGRIARPRMGYVGVVKAQLDLRLLRDLARKRSDWSFVLVGPLGYLGDKQQLLADLRALGNVYLLGAREVADLPAYVQHMDACLMCYEVNDYTQFIYPLKLHEYLATGRPVVSAPIDAVAEFADVVQIASSVHDWERALECALVPQSDEQAGAATRRARARDYDWDRLVSRIADTLQSDLAHRTASAAHQ